MTLKTGVAIGAGLGFLIGLEIGASRYQQVQAVLDKVGQTEPIRSVADVGRDMLDGTTDMAKSVLSDQMATASEKIRSFAGEVAV